MMLSTTTAAMPCCPLLILQNGTDLPLNPPNYVHLQARWCHEHAGRRRIYSTLCIAAIVLGDVDFTKEKNNYPLRLRLAKEYAFSCMDENAGYIHTMKERLYIFPQVL